MVDQISFGEQVWRFIKKCIYFLLASFSLYLVLFYLFLYTGTLLKYWFKPVLNFGKYVLDAEAIVLLRETMTIPPPIEESGIFENPIFLKYVQLMFNLVGQIDIQHVYYTLAGFGLLVWWNLQSFPSVRRVILKCRGIYVPESMIQGSNFVQGNIPRSQFGVYRAGLLSDTFVGYGLRISEEIVVMPLHVFNYARPEVIFKNENNGTSIYVGRKVAIETTTVSDLCYLKLSAVDLTTLAISIARMPNGKNLTGFVNIAGRKGVSSGKLTLHMTRGIVEYSGSTIAGYSGAAYTIGNHVYGIHIGSGGTSNLGISYVVWMRDLPSIFKMAPVENEGSITFSSPSMLGDFEENLLPTKSKTWSFEDIVERKKPVSSGTKYPCDYSQHMGRSDLWADDLEEEASEEITYDYIQKASIGHLNSLIKVIEAAKSVRENSTRVPFKQQGIEGEESVLEVSSELNKPRASLALQINYLEKRILELEESCKTEQNFNTEKFEKLEYQVKKNTGEISRISSVSAQAYTEVREIRKPRPQPQKVIKAPYKCYVENCGIRLRTPIAVLNHLAAEHKIKDPEMEKIVKDEFIPEGIASDESNSVGVNFIKAPLRRKRAPYLPNISNTVEKANQFQSLVKSQEDIKNSLSKLIEILQKPAATSTGQASGLSQS